MTNSTEVESSPPEPVAEPKLVEVVLPEPEPEPAPAPEPEPTPEPAPVARRKARVARPRKRDDGNSSRGMRVRY